MSIKDNFAITGKKIWVTGHKGLLGSAIVRRLDSEDCQILTSTRQECDLTQQKQVNQWLEKNQPDAIIVVAGKVGGIHANSHYPFDFLYQNMMIAANIINAAYQQQTPKLLYLGSSCIYPKNSPQPIKENYLLQDVLEPTNEYYALAKISGIMLCRALQKQYGVNFISGMPTNLYGYNDNFHPMDSHVPAALLSRFHNAKINNLDEVAIWGSGQPRREFLFSDDCADACIYLLRYYKGIEHINIGTGEDIAIGDFARKIMATTEYKGNLTFDSSKPDGMMRKVLDVSNIHALGWQHQTSLDEGLKLYYQWYCQHYG